MVSPGILLVDKSAGMTSHDVVAAARRALGARKIGHAGTLDPMATGLLVLGVEGATRLLTYIVGADKTYVATIRLGSATTTDDAEGETTRTAEAADVATVDSSRIAAGVSALTGDISQVPSSVSAIKIDGWRAYDRVRAGELIELAARSVTVSRFSLTAERRADATIDLDVIIDCSSGTYIRALARDLGADLGIGGHLTALRRTRIGPFDIADAVPGEVMSEAMLLTPADAAARLLPRLDVSAEEARDLRHGKRLPGAGGRTTATPIAAVDPDGTLVGILERRGTDLKSAMNMPEVRG